jgi:hypothetical protein
MSAQKEVYLLALYKSSTEYAINSQEDIDRRSFTRLKVRSVFRRRGVGLLKNVRSHVVDRTSRRLNIANHTGTSTS